MLISRNHNFTYVKHCVDVKDVYFRETLHYSLAIWFLVANLEPAHLYLKKVYCYPFNCFQILILYRQTVSLVSSFPHFYSIETSLVLVWKLLLNLVIRTTVETLPTRQVDMILWNPSCWDSWMGLDRRGSGGFRGIGGSLSMLPSLWAEANPGDRWRECVAWINRHRYVRFVLLAVDNFFDTSDIECQLILDRCSILCV